MRKAIYLFLALQFSLLSVHAQLQLPKALERPIELALERSKEIANKELSVMQTELERKSVKSKFIPRLEATGTYAYLDHRMTIDVPGLELPLTGYELFAQKTTVDNQVNALHGGLTAKSVLFSGFQITNGSKALEQKSRGDALLIETDKDELIVDVVTSFDKLRFIRASEALIADSKRRLVKEEERVNKAIANGLAIPFDRDKITLARLELESKQTELEESKELLFAKIQYLTGLSQVEVEAISYDLDPFLLANDLTVDNKQELEALAAYKKAGEYMLKKEKGSFLPQAAAFAGLSYTSLFNGASQFNIPYLPDGMSQPHLNINEVTIAPNWMAGVALKWEIFSGMERKHKVKQAELNIQQLDNKLEDSRDKLNLLLMQKLAAYRSAEKQIDLAQQKEVVAENSLVLAKKQYMQGLISINQRLEAENDFIKASQEKTGALINQRQAALDASMVTGKLVGKIQYY